jgi:tetratricopeptide (TPR) repeat protein
MHSSWWESDAELSRERVNAARTVPDLARLLRELRRRDARRRSTGELSYRALAAKAGWSFGMVGHYLNGKILPPTDRFDDLVRLLGATPAEQGLLATARDRIAEDRRVESASPAPPVADALAGIRPAQLPSDLAGFTGRTAELSDLDHLLPAAAGRRPATTAPAVIAGGPGIGKTALAVHWAHRVAELFPDGHLFVNLRGYDTGQSLAAEAVLAEFLRALGVDGAAIPDGLDARAAQYRTLLHGRRMLVLLDNAGDEEQVRPLLPGDRSCQVVVTSRDRLSGLTVREGARRLELDVLSPPEAHELLRALIGARVDTEPAAAATVADQCARLPLALRIAAELAAVRSGTRLSDLVTELADERRRLDAFDGVADARSALRGVFGWSYRRLPAGAARAFRLLGLHPGADLDGPAATALTGAADPDLATLLRVHLVQEFEPGRYRMHDLLRAYAAERVGEEPETERRAARARLMEHYLDTTAAAMDVLYPADRHRRPAAGTPAGPIAPVHTEPLARAWLAAERANLLAVTALAAEQGRPDLVYRLAATRHRHLLLSGYSADAVTSGSHALRAAQDQGDRRAEAVACANLGGAHMQLNDYDDAVSHFRRALTGYEQTGDVSGAGRALGAIGWVHAELGRYPEALDYYQRALTRYRDADDQFGLASMSGWVGLELGRAGRYDEAIEHFRQARAICRRISASGTEVEVLSDLGQVLIWAGRHRAAQKPIREALALAEEIGDRLHQPDLLHNLAESLAAAGRPEEALAHYQAALTLATTINQRHLQARAANGIAHIHHRGGRPEIARRYWQDALAIYTALGLPQAQDVRAALEATEL